MQFRSRYTCPNCAAPLDGTNIFIHDTDGTTPLNKHRPPQTAYEAKLQAAKEPKFVCGVSKCQLPDGFGQRESVIIGLVGAFGSSKSHLMYAMITELTSNAGPLARLGYGFYLDQYSEPNFRTWYSDTAEQHKPLAGTGVDETRSITVVATRSNAKQAVNLVFVDTSGENLISGSRAAQNASYLYATDVYLFLVPPDVLSAVPTFDLYGASVSKEPGGLVGSEAAAATTDRRRRDTRSTAALSILTEIVRKRRAVGGRSGRSPMLGVVVTKADVLQRAVQADASIGMDGIEQLWQPTDYRGRGRDVYQRIMNDSALARSMLVQMQAEGILRLAEGVSRDCAYFVVAATGSPLNANQMFIPLEPRRVLDPIVWILAQLESAKVL